MTRRKHLLITCINTVLNTVSFLYITASGSFSCMPECIFVNLQEKELPRDEMFPSHISPQQLISEHTILSYVILPNNELQLYTVINSADFKSHRKNESTVFHLNQSVNYC